MILFGFTLIIVSIEDKGTIDNIIIIDKYIPCDQLKK